MAPPESLLFPASSDLRFPAGHRVQPRRFAVRVSSSQSLRGLLGDECYLHQFAPRAPALVMLLTSVLLTPTVSYCNRAITSEVMTRALEVCDQKIACGFVDKPCAEPTNAPRSRGFNTALDTAVGMIALGLVDKKPGASDSLLQLYVGGATTVLGERHYAFASDCFPLQPADGLFFVNEKVAEDRRADPRRSMLG